MARITQLDDASALTDLDLFEVVQGGVNKKMTGAQVKASATALANEVIAANNKANDADIKANQALAIAAAAEDTAGQAATTANGLSGQIQQIDTKATNALNIATQAQASIYTVTDVASNADATANLANLKADQAVLSAGTAEQTANTALNSVSLLTDPVEAGLFLGGPISGNDEAPIYRRVQYSEVEDAPDVKQADWTEDDEQDPGFVKNKPGVDVAGGLAGIGVDGKLNPIVVYQADWAEDDVNLPGFIRNKPGVNIPEGAVYLDALGKIPATSQYQADWTETVTTAPGYIVNKPDVNVAEGMVMLDISGKIPATSQYQADWTETVSTAPGYITNKPDVNVAEGMVMLDALGKIPATSQYQANWTEADTTAPGYIVNKPDVNVADGMVMLDALGKIPATSQYQADWTETITSAPGFITGKPTLGTAAALDAGAASGVASLDATGKIPIAQIPTNGVQSVAMTAPAQFAIAGTPITDTGTLAVTWVNQSINQVLAGPASGGAGAPTFRALVANDIPSLPASKISSGTIPVARGGTGAATLTGYVKGSGTSAMTAVAKIPLADVDTTGTVREFLGYSAGGATQNVTMSPGIWSTVVPPSGKHLAHNDEGTLGFTAVQTTPLEGAVPAWKAGGQLEVAETPVAPVDASSKGYVDDQVNTTLWDMLAEYSFFFSGIPALDETVFRMTANRNFVLETDTLFFMVGAEVSDAVEATFELQVSGLNVGTAVIPATQTSGTVTVPDLVNIPAGATVKVICRSTVTTLKGVNMTLLFALDGE